MALFASTLYPQTNPTNPILLTFRTVWSAEAAGLMCVGMTREINRGDWNDVATYLQRQHARRVIARLAALSG